MDHEAPAPRRRPSAGWILTVLFVVLGGAYAFFLFAIFFFGALDNVDSLRSTAYFFLIMAIVAFGVLLFMGAAPADHEGWEEEEAVSETDLDQEAVPEEEVSELAEPVATGIMECPACGRQNPPGANFCNACGTRLTPSIEGGPDDSANDPDQG
jgi:hypothetical protein